MAQSIQAGKKQLAFMYEHRLNNEFKTEVDMLLVNIDFSLQSYRWKLVYAFPGLYKVYSRFLNKKSLLLNS